MYRLNDAPITGILRVGLFMCLLFGDLNLRGQINADTQFVREHKIKTALFKEKKYPQYILADYDTKGRLIQLTEYTSYPTSNYSYVKQFDSSGREIRTYFFSSSDTFDVMRPVGKHQPKSVSHTRYLNDSTSVSIDTSWDSESRIIALGSDTIIIRWLDLPTPPEHRSSFHKESIVSYQHYSWHRIVYRHEFLPYIQADTIETSESYDFTGTCENERIIYESTKRLRSGDSVYTIKGKSWYTIHGKYDTSYYSTVGSKHAVNDSPDFSKSIVNSRYTYIKSAKFLNVYYVTMQVPDVFPKKSRYIRKEPWNEFGMGYIPIIAIDPDDVSAYQTIEHFSWQYSGKPTFTYWPDSNR